MRIVWVSSSAHFVSAAKEGTHFSAIEMAKDLHPHTLYGQSKLGNIHMARAMADRLNRYGTLVVSLHPGNIEVSDQQVCKADLKTRFKSNFGQRIGTFERVVLKLFVHPVRLGALTQIYASISSELTMDDAGTYFIPWARKHHTTHKKADDPEAVEATFAYVNNIVESKMLSTASSSVISKL